MPPKNPKDKKKKAQKELILDGKNITKMTPEQLVRHAILEAKLLVDAKKQRSLQEQERDLLYRKLEIVRDDMVRQEAKLIVQERDMDDDRHVQHAELKVARQRAKHLRYELDENLAKSKVEETAFKQEMQRIHVELITETGHEQDEQEVKNLNERKAFEQDTKEIMAQAEKKHQIAGDNYRNALADRTEDLRCEKEKIDEDSKLDIRNHTCLLDQKRLEQIDILQRNFEKNYREMKQYFQELTHHNLTLINDLAAQSHQLKQHLSDLYARYHDVQKQTDASREPVRLQTLRLAALKHESNTFDKEKASFERLRKTYAVMKEEREALLKEIKEHDADFFRMKEEQEALKKNFAPAMSEAKEILGLEASFIRGKAVNMKRQMDAMKTSLHETAIVIPDARMEECLHELEQTEQQCLKNVALKKDMQTTIHKMSKLYNDTLVTMRYIIEEYALPADQIDLQPFEAGMALKSAEIGRVSATITTLKRST